MIDKTHKLLLWSLALLLLLTACGGAGPDFSNQEGVEVNIFAPLGRTVDAQDIETQGVPVDPETGETGVARAELAVYSGGTQLFFNDGRVVDEGEGESVTLTPDDSNVTLFLPEGTYRFELTAFDDRDNVLAQGEVEQRVSENSRVSVPLTSLIGAARFEVPESIKGNQVFDAFLRVSPPNRPDLEVALGDFDVTYEVKEPSVQLPGASNIGVRVAAACDAVEITATLNNDLSDTVSASASVPVVDEKCEGTGTDVGTDLVPPFIDIRTPQADATVNRSFTLQGDVNDQQSGVDKVEVYEGTVKLGNANIDSDAMTWSFDASLEDGRYTLIAVAYDKAGNTSRAEVNLKVKEGSGGNNPGETCTNPVNVPDQNLRRILESALGLDQGEAITCETLGRVAGITGLGTDGEVSDTPLGSLEGLQFATGLESLQLEGYVIGDYTAIADLTNLKVLELGALRTPSLEPLRNLTALYDLRINGLSRDENFTAEDADVLGGLVNLRTLSLTDYGLTNITALQNLMTLERLDLSTNAISDLEPLQNLTRLEFLSLSDNQVSDLSPLQNLSKLRELDLKRNQIGNLSGLQDLTQLSLLNLRYNQVSDLTPLQNLPNLDNLELSDNQITDISPLVNNEGLGSSALIYVQNNLLETCPGTQDRADIEALNSRGVRVIFDAPTNCNGDGGGSETCTNPVNIPDEALRRAILEELGRFDADDTEITCEDLARLTGLVLETETDADFISDFEGLQYAVNLRVFSFPTKSLSPEQLAPLSNLPRLEKLVLTLELRDSNVGEDALSFVKDLANLKVLSVSPFTTTELIEREDEDIVGPRVDLSPLQNLTKLQTLGLRYFRPNSLSPLQNLSELTELQLTSGDISDISALQNLTKLTFLQLGGNEIDNVSPLQNLTSLNELRLAGNRIGDIGALQNLTELTSLDLAYNGGIGNLNPLQNFTNLANLDLSGNKLSDLTPLQNLTSLTDLMLRDNEIGDLTPLQNLAGLVNLSLSGNQISDLNPLPTFANLSDLNLSGNEISDLGPLVANEGIVNDGDAPNVSLFNNPLDLCSGSDDIADINTLQSRGVSVSYEGPQTCQP